MATWRKTLSSNQYYEVILNVDQTSQSIANNTSNISWSLQVRKSFGSGFWGADGTASTWAVSIDGTNVSSSSSSYDFRGGAPLTKTIASGTRTITHNGDGSKSIGVSGYWKDNANGLGSATASGTMALSTIPRASELTAFSFASHLKNGVANTINYTVSKKSTSFRHQIQLRDGSTTVFEWDNSNSNGNSTITLTVPEVNTLLARMPTSTSKTFTLRIATRGSVNGGWIGSAVTRNATATVHADVKPTISGQAFGINQNRIDQEMGKYIQGFTKVDAVFSPTAGYGSSIQASSMTVQKTDGSDSQVISGNVGTTGREVLSSGDYRVVYTTTDTRGRSTSATSSNFTVQPYSAPVITSLNLFRYEATPTIVYVGVTGNFSSIGTSNLATLSIQRKSGSTWETIGENNVSNTGGISREVNVPNNSITSSYEYRAIITDFLDGRAEVINTISTQQIVMDIYRNQGVAFGKFYEPDKGGVVQVGGPATFDNYLKLTGRGQDTRLHIEPDYGNASIELGSLKGASTPYIDFHSTGSGNDYDVRFLGNSGVAGQNGRGSVNIDAAFVHVAEELTSYGAKTIGQGIVHAGANGNGHYIKFNDGTMICWHEMRTSTGAGYATGNMFRTNSTLWTFPASFYGTPLVQSNPIGVASETWAGMGQNDVSWENASFMVWSSWNRGTATINVALMAIGRWA